VGGICGTLGGRERCLWDFGWEARRMRPLGRPRRSCEDNVKMDLRETDRLGELDSAGSR
jgi:hypothetical protein